MKKSPDRIVIFLSLGTGISYLCFLLYYLLHSHAGLLADYLEKTPEFFRYQTFVRETFTDALKSRGNTIVIAAMLLLVLFWLLFYPFLRIDFRRIFAPVIISIRQSFFWIMGLMFLCIGFSIYGYNINPLCTDEAFSAQNFAQKPLGHLLTYYPLPNNHIFFNVLNHFLGKLSGDNILSGRLLSALFYSLLIGGNFLFLRRFIHSNLIVFLCSALLAQQLMVWGFGTQSRGYALYYLLQWFSLVAWYNYFFDTNHDKRAQLLLLVLCNILGAWTIPSFIYLLVFEAGTALLLCIYHKELNILFWRAMLLSITGIFLVYVPVFCYSGIQSVLSNKYVSGLQNDRIQMVYDWFNYFLKSISVNTFGFAALNYFVATAFFILPFALYLAFRKKLEFTRPFLLIALMIWLAVFFMVVYMKQLPVLRAIGFQMHLSLLILLFSFSFLMIAVIKNKTVLNAFFILLMLVASYSNFSHNKSVVATELYGQNTVAFMNGLREKTIRIKENETVWLSDESYMWNFILPSNIQKSNYDCAFNNQDLLIISEDDKAIPNLDLSQYAVQDKISWFTVYHRK